MKKIVTHFSPDLDAVCSIWLVKRFLPGWNEAEVLFVPAGSTLEDQPVDQNKEVLHVDTGLGRFDHHQSDEFTCAAQKLFLHIKEAREKGRKIFNWNEKALERMIDVVNSYDHFQEVFFPDATADFYDFSLSEIIEGWRLILDGNTVVSLSLFAFDGLYQKFKQKISAEEKIKEEGIGFKTRWGKGIAFQTGNDEVMHLAQKMGYKIVVRKDKKLGHLRIKSIPLPEIDLTAIYKKLVKKDPEATWFLHPGRHMLLNGSLKNPKTKPTKLSLEEVIKLIKKIKNYED